jgi:hypothetical protein
MKIKAVVWKDKFFSQDDFQDLNRLLDDSKQTDIFVNSSSERSVENIIGTVDECVYNPGEGIVFYATVFDSDASELIRKGLVSVAPTLISERNGLVKTIRDSFLTPNPSDEVGDITVIQSSDL